MGGRVALPFFCAFIMETFRNPRETATLRGVSCHYTHDLDEKRGGKVSVLPRMSDIWHSMATRAKKSRGLCAAYIYILTHIKGRYILGSIKIILTRTVKHMYTLCYTIILLLIIKYYLYMLISYVILMLCKTLKKTF